MHKAPGRFQVGFKGRLAVRRFLLILTGDLSSGSGVSGVIDAALDAEEDSGDEHYGDTEERDGTPPGSAFKAAIKKR
jgi:hypothetical protein